jgi:VIT1/CCC1 family predicted Fe2+/Mn2+ transporter/rubrerythrin
MKSSDIRRYLANRQAEVDSTLQYLAMAEHEPDAGTARVYRNLADIEQKHAEFWETRLRDAGHDPGPRKPSWRARVLIFSARRWGAKSVLETVASSEYEARNDYVPQKETAATSMTSEEHSHARVLRAMLAKGSLGAASFARTEKGHRRLGGNALRAAVLGANDGLSSNLSLVMGVAGASVDTHTILLTGIAGLLAGACSMAMGEWVSVTSSRELAERELRTEREELESNPEEEAQELQLIYEAKGLSPDEAAELAKKLLSDDKTALDVLAREELGIDPAELGGSPWVAAGTSMLLFALGALIPVLPFIFLKGNTAIVTSLAAGGLGLGLIGTAIAIFTGRSAVFSAARQLLLGLLAAGVTFGIGHLIGVAMAG